jgi:hypothetical protein
VRVCQDRFVASSEVLQRYLARHGADLAAHTRVLDVGSAMPERQAVNL